MLQIDTVQMALAARLTRAGKLVEATKLLQRLLGAHGTRTETTTAEPGIPRLEGTGAGPRKGLGQTLRDLARTRSAGLHPRQDAAVPQILPDGAIFETLSFSNDAGSRDYKLYVPAHSPADGRRPLLVMLHGCTQTPDDFAAGTRMNLLAEEHGFLVAYPAQPSSANPNKCWNWFNRADQIHGQGEPSIVAGLTLDIVRRHGIDPRRVYVAGLSAGAAAAAILGSQYPGLYAAVGIHSGLPSGAAHDVPSAFAAMRNGAAGNCARMVPSIIFHGDADPTVHPRNADEAAAQSTGIAADLVSTVERREVPLGHAHSRTVFATFSGRVMCEKWIIHGAGHAWAGGSPAGSYTDPRGPDASREMIRFFMQQQG